MKQIPPETTITLLDQDCVELVAKARENKRPGERAMSLQELQEAEAVRAAAERAAQPVPGMEVLDREGIARKELTRRQRIGISP